MTGRIAKSRSSAPAALMEQAEAIIAAMRANASAEQTRDDIRALTTAIRSCHRTEADRRRRATLGHDAALLILDALDARAARLAPADPQAEAIDSARLDLAIILRQHGLRERLLREAWERCGRRRGDPAQAHLHALLSLSGRGSEVPEDGLVEAYGRIRGPSRHAGHTYADAVEAWRRDEAARRWQALGPTQRDEPLIRFYRGVQLLAEAIERRQPPPEREVRAIADRIDDAGEPTLASDLQARIDLAIGHPERIRLDEREFDSLSQSQWIAATPIEAAMATARWNELGTLIEHRRSAGLLVLVDEVAAAARALAEGADGQAAAHLASAEALAMRSGQLGRLDLLLLPLPWLGPSELLRLSRLAPGQRLPAAADRTPSVVGDSPAIARIREEIARFAVLDLPVLITGPSGSGKELVAHELHRQSPRARRPFIACNCAALSEGLLEAELFGHARGAFTGADRARPGLIEEAADGSLLLDEIGDASPGVQAALLRLLDHGEYRPVGSAKARKAACRFLCATNIDLRAAVAQGGFRGDLLYRLRRLEIAIPPLARRQADIVPIARRFLAEIAPLRTLGDDAGPWLRAQTWPGNARELRGLLERVCALEDGTVIGARELSAAHRDPPTRPHLAKRNAPSGSPPSPADGVPAADPGAPVLERRLSRAAECIRRRGTITRKELCRLLEVSPGTATTYLHELIERGLVERIEPTAAVSSHAFRWKA